MKPTSVWIVQQDATPDDTILGVFGSLSEAAQFAREMKTRFPDHVIYSEYSVGYRFDSGSASYTTH